MPDFSGLPLVIEPSDLLGRLAAEQLILVDLTSAARYAQGHIPGAHFVDPKRTQLGQPPAPGLLPAKADLEKSLTLDPKALQGSAYTSLAALYDRVPGWPIGFGDSDKAEQLIKQALQLNSDGIDTLYFWGDHLYRQKRYAEAKAALQKALQAAPRPGRETADAGRRKEIATLLVDVNKKFD